LRLHTLEIRREGRHTRVDALELRAGVDDEGVEGVENLLLVVEETLLVLLRRIRLQELIEGSGFRREFLHRLLAAADRESGVVLVVGNRQRWI
jgi:hypothetical protein